MNTYFDTGILVKTFILETDSAEAVSLVDEAGDPVVHSHFHGIEIPNAIRLKRFRGEISKSEEATALRIYKEDVDSGRLRRADYDLGEVFNRAQSLSAKYSAETGARSLDLLHVAAALEAGCARFASFDERQRKIATLAGLNVIPSKRKK